jgi:hypothetical protein
VSAFVARNRNFRVEVDVDINAGLHRWDFHIAASREATPDTSQ